MRQMEPVVLKVKGRRLADWGMDKTYPANAADPPASPAESNQPEVDLELVPYGWRGCGFPSFLGSRRMMPGLERAAWHFHFGVNNSSGNSTSKSR